MFLSPSLEPLRNERSVRAALVMLFVCQRYAKAPVVSFPFSRWREKVPKRPKIAPAFSAFPPSMAVR
jgi:hypothetical protein